MKKYTIQVKEQLSKSVEIEANSEFEAISKVRKLYFEEEIVLDENDFDTLSIDITEHSIATNLDFANFVLKNAEDMITNLSIEELAKIGFGDYFEAIKQFDAKYYGN